MSENIYIEPSNLDYVIIKTKESTVENEGIYEATRKAWHAKLSTAEPYKYALSVVQGVVREVYEVEKWQMSGDSDRIEFIGHVAPEYIKEWFMGKMIPEKYRVKGLASPFLYKKLVEGEETAEILEPTTIYTEPSNLDYVIIKTKESTVENEGIYEATRKAWHAKLETAKPYKYALSVVQGVVREVYEVEKWQMSGDSDRIEFIGHVAPEYIKEWFMGKMIPEKYRVKGLASPFLYSKKVAGEPTAAIAKDAPKKAPACVDCQGREYKTVKIGNQEWMAENLAVTKDRDGRDLVLGKDYFYPNGDEANVKEYGLLYTWEAAMRIAPKGWHLPSEAELTELEQYCGEHYALGGDESYIAKSLAATERWKSYDEVDHAVGNDLSKNNASGFSALPAGFHHDSVYYVTGYVNFNCDACFWSATEFSSTDAYNRYLCFENAYVSRDGRNNKTFGCSVRCVKD